ncbi:hypothetical protein GCM10022406_24060 [Hymenobacter algoricola]|uniref:Uncharacterized protein n=2 Tax=Hymenobacter algoricola TaxID=486267 RepID=A0ABP7N874_9BACT
MLLSCGCGAKNCDACAVEEYQLRLVFDLDSARTTGFRKAEIDAAYIVRYATPDFTGPADTVRQPIRSGSGSYRFYPAGIELLRLPAPALNAVGATVFRPEKASYRVVLPTTSHRYDVREIELTGETGKGCCACYRNARRRFRLNGQYTSADGVPGVTVLSK